jgi:hypothetical protein
MIKNQGASVFACMICSCPVRRDRNGGDWLATSLLCDECHHAELILLAGVAGLGFRYLVTGHVGEEREIVSQSDAPPNRLGHEWRRPVFWRRGAIHWEMMIP